jgi:vanillate O-demethylase monooxygenase subunit
MRAVSGEPYTWPVSVERRVENFTDLAHFAWVHDGSLGDRRRPEVPLPEIRREAGALRFGYLPPALASDPTALTGASDYTVPIPGTVHIDFDVPGVGRRALWMTASPLDGDRCRTFWFTCRSDDLPGDDAPHLEFQALVLAEDEPVIRGQHPPGIPWSGDDRELSVPTDLVSLAYRRYLLDLAATDTAVEMAAVLGVSAPVPA